MRQVIKESLGIMYFLRLLSFVVGGVRLWWLQRGAARSHDAVELVSLRDANVSWLAILSYNKFR